MAGLPRSRVEDVLRLVDLAAAANRPAGTYSQGMRQRLGLATTLLGDPHLLVLDEPANGLDPQGVRWLRDFLRRMAAEGRTVLISSHVLAAVAQTVDDVVVIHRPRLVEQGPVERLTTGGGVLVRSPEAARLCYALEGEGIPVTEAADGSLVAHTDEPGDGRRHRVRRTRPGARVDAARHLAPSVPRGAALVASPDCRPVSS